MNQFFQDASTAALKSILRLFFLTSLALLGACTSLAQTGPVPGYATPRPYTQAELDQMLAPIALYPDALLSQILMAATYPQEVLEAAQWSRSHPEHQGQQAVQAVAIDPYYQWDPSVTSLVAFPQLLRRMEENYSWTRRLGEAFINQQGELMDRVQYLRLRAMEQGNLRSNEQIRVYPQGQIVIVEPVSPQIVYVPYYNPNVVYGRWWWGSYPPVYWAPWPGYLSPGYRGPYLGAGLIWSSGISIGVNFFFGLFDWREHRVYIHPDRSPRHDPRRYQPYSSPRLGPVLIWRHQPVARPSARLPSPRLTPPTSAPSRPVMQGEHQRNDRYERDNRQDRGNRNEMRDPAHRDTDNMRQKNPAHGASDRPEPPRRVMQNDPNGFDNRNPQTASPPSSAVPVAPAVRTPTPRADEPRPHFNQRPDQRPVDHPVAEPVVDRGQVTDVSPRVERMKRNQGNERAESAQRGERGERTEPGDRGERSERNSRSERTDRPEQLIQERSNRSGFDSESGRQPRGARMNEGNLRQ